MDKIRINNQEINLLSANALENGMELNFSELTLTEAEALFPATGTVSFEVINESGEVYGKYANLRVNSITKNVIESEDRDLEEIIAVKLGIINKTTERINELEEVVDTLLLMNLEM